MVLLFWGKQSYDYHEIFTPFLSFVDAFRPSWYKREKDFNNWISSYLWIGKYHNPKNISLDVSMHHYISRLQPSKEQQLFRYMN